MICGANSIVWSPGFSRQDVRKNDVHENFDGHRKCERATG